jgi:hypothetical protein
MPTEPRVFQCRHIFTDGHRCGSPALRNEHFCYYHHNARRPGPRQPQVKTLTDRKSSTFDLPSPADLAERAGVQLALGQILHKIAHNEIDPRRARLLLYGLQIASRNLPREAPQKPQHSESEDELVEEITVDPELGALAPKADWEENRPKGSIERLLEELLEVDKAFQADPSRKQPAQIHSAPNEPGLDLQAAAAARNPDGASTAGSGPDASPHPNPNPNPDPGSSPDLSLLFLRLSRKTPRGRGRAAARAAIQRYTSPAPPWIQSPLPGNHSPQSGPAKVATTATRFQSPGQPPKPGPMPCAVCCAPAPADRPAPAR